MLSLSEFTNVRKSFSLLSTSFKCAQIKQTFVPSRNFRNFIFKTPPNKINRENTNGDEYDLKTMPFTGYDDPTFTDRMFINIKEGGSIKKGTAIFLRECKKFYSEETTKIKQYADHRIESKINRVDMLFTFDSQEDVEKFIVNTDSSFLMGYSSASLRITDQKTALFKGNICTDLPKDGNVKISGYANMISKLQRVSFFRIKPYNWADYTHLVFKIRGDGRTYLVVLTAPGSYTELSKLSYAHPLYTRGGPYWQIAKIPFSHFYLMNKGCILKKQSSPILLKNIQKLGITAAAYEGPFKLEIDYIGLEFDPYHKTASPYEGYRSINFI